MDIKQEITWLENELAESDFLYYNFGSSDYTDEEYDQMEERLLKLDPKNKRFKDGKRNVVGSKVPTNTKNGKKAWKKVKHKFKMGSQLKVTTLDALKKWEKELVGEYYRLIVQDKLDGISLQLDYKGGKLVSAVTRGDGEEGEDILDNALKMEGVPATIDFDKDLEVRCEVLLYKKNMVYFDDAKTARNMAAGVAKRHSGEGVSWLNVKAYDIRNWKELGFKKVTSSLKLLEDLGFDVVNYRVCRTLQEVQDVYEEYIDHTRDELEWIIDGLVVKAGIFGDDDWAAPKRSIAYKFPPKIGYTTLLDVVWQDTGGRISPVAILEPVVIDGVTIGRATLNNVDHIKKLGVKIGDTVKVSRRNDVIPCIEGVHISDPNGKEIKPPTHDDEGFPIVHEKNSSGQELVYLVSTNPDSRSKRVRRILKWFVAHGAKGLANATIESIVDAEIARDLPEFYDVCMNGHDDLMDIDGFGKGTFKIMNQAALKSCKTDVVTFLKAMDLNGIGTKILEIICSENGKEIDLDGFLGLSTETAWIAAIPGIGDSTAKHLQNELKKKEKLIKEMASRVEIESWKPVQAKSTKVNGLKFCFTGKMAHGRKELEDAVKANSGIVAGVSKNLDYLVTNDPSSGSSKNKKVDTLNNDGANIQRISEQDFINMVGGLT